MSGGEQEETGMTKPEALGGPRGRFTILVADDEKNIRLTVSEALADMDGTVLTAVSGEDALERLDSERVDVLLLDLALPGVDGLDVLRHLSAERPDTRVIIITAHGSIRTAVEAMKLGAVDFIAKPFAPDEIREAVRRAVGSSTGRPRTSAPSHRDDA